MEKPGDSSAPDRTAAPREWDRGCEKPLSAMAVELASLPSDADLKGFVVKKLAELTGASIAWFSDYSPADRTLVLSRIEAAPEILKKATAILGKPPGEIRSPVSEQMHREIVGSTVGMRRTITEVSFGAVPPQAGARIEELLRADRFIGLSHVIEGELYGATLLALRRGSPDPPAELLASMAHIVAVSLRRRRAEEALRESEQKYRSIVENSSEGILFTAPDGQVFSANPSACRMLGRTEEQIIKAGRNGVVDPLDPRLAAGLKVREMTGRFDGELTLLRGDGSPFPARVSSAVFRDAAGRERTAMMISDLSERMEAERTLLESGERYRSLVDNAAAGVATMDIEGRFILVNKALCGMSGHSEQELLGKPFIDFLHPDDAGRLLALFSQAGKGSVREPQVEFRGIRKDGSVVHCFSAPTILRRGGEIIGFNAIIFDITDRKLAEAELVKLSTAVKMAREGIVLTDGGGEVTFANDAAAGMLGCDGKTLQGGALVDLFAPEDRKKARILLAETLRRGSVAKVELDLTGEAGEAVPVEVSSSVMRDECGKTKGTVLILRDITERQRAERDMKDLLLTYEFEEGNLYLVKESGPALSLEAFRDLLRAGYRGAVISRTPLQRSPLGTDQPLEYRWIGEAGGTGRLPFRLEGIARWLDGLPKGRAVLVDRMDYLISRNGFPAVLRFVQRLREQAYLMGHVVILSIDPAAVGGRDLRLLDKECREVLRRSRPQVPADLLEVLEHVCKQGLLGSRPTLTALGGALGLSKPTARKRVRDLSRQGYVVMSPRGRTKVAELTDKGRRLLLK